ncbi:uncharacterized protein LOC144141045 [Haemaphysalis longicornis]
MWFWAIVLWFCIPGALQEKEKNVTEDFKFEDSLSIKKFLHTHLFIWTVDAIGERRGITNKVDEVTKETRRNVYFTRNFTVAGKTRSVKLVGKFLKLPGKKQPIAMLVGKADKRKIMIEELTYGDHNNTCGIFWTTYLLPFPPKNASAGQNEDVCELRVKSKSPNPSPSAECKDAFVDICNAGLNITLDGKRE